MSFSPFFSMSAIPSQQVFSLSAGQSASFNHVSNPVSYFQRISKSVIQFFNISVTPSQQIVSKCPPVVTSQRVSQPVSACQSARFSVNVSHSGQQVFSLSASHSASFDTVSNSVSHFKRVRRSVLIQLFHISVTPCQ